MPKFLHYDPKTKVYKVTHIFDERLFQCRNAPEEEFDPKSLEVIADSELELGIRLSTEGHFDYGEVKRETWLQLIRNALKYAHFAHAAFVTFEHPERVADEKLRKYHLRISGTGKDECMYHFAKTYLLEQKKSNP